MKRQIFVLAIVVIVSSGVSVAGDASATWAQNCASCHGKDGSGNTVMGKKLGVKTTMTQKSKQRLATPKRNEQSRKA
jgi:cytochrome c553